MPSPLARDTQDRPRTRQLFRLAAAAATLTVAMGAINSATGSGFACPTWPGCYPGQFGPEAEVHDLIEFSHRIVAGLTGIILLVTAIVGSRLPRVQKPARTLPWATVVGAIAAAVFGMMIVKNHGIPKPLSMLDLFGALTCLVGATLAYMSMHRGSPTWRWTPLSKLAAGCLAGLVVLHELGIVVAGPGSFTPVLGWPMRITVGHDVLPAVQGLRFALAIVLLTSLVELVRRGLGRCDLRVLSVTLAVALLVEVVMGQVIARQGTEFWFTIIFCTAAVVILSCTTILLGRAALDD